MRVVYGSVDQWVKGKKMWENSKVDDLVEYEYEYSDQVDTDDLEDSALSNRDKRHNKFPKFKRRM